MQEGSIAHLELLKQQLKHKDELIELLKETDALKTVFFREMIGHLNEAIKSLTSK
jgi:hypothetical protein